jgi:hypothetical protein
MLAVTSESIDASSLFTEMSNLRLEDIRNFCPHMGQGEGIFRLLKSRYADKNGAVSVTQALPFFIADYLLARRELSDGNLFTFFDEFVDRFKETAEAIELKPKDIQLVTFIDGRFVNFSSYEGVFDLESGSQVERGAKHFLYMSSLNLNKLYLTHLYRIKNLMDRRNANETEAAPV